MEPVEYFKLLQQHDWYYDYSDDSSVWQKGRLALQKIISLSEANAILLKMYNDYSKYIFNDRPKPVIETYNHFNNYDRRDN